MATKTESGRAVRPTKKATASKTGPKRLSRAEIVRRVAKQYAWVVADARDGQVLAIRSSRSHARHWQVHNIGLIGATVIVRVDLRVKGVRA